ncbi:MAG TPA: hypothetical protein VGF55_16720 [Gemmataceae bacterium]|jgi:NAD(P)-dependent dehydrogenase (short-subunit alcohol dehydrogenase family)
MPVYPCPECGAQLRPAQPVPAGKKLRCPKCETVFAPTGKAAAKAAKPAAAAVPAPEEEVERYGLGQDTAPADEAAVRAAFDPIKDRFKRSDRGPALVLVVKPSTWLLRVGVTTCLAAIAGVLFAIWPMIFKVEDVQPPDKMARFRVGPENNTRRFKEMTPEDWRDHWLIFAASVFQFAWGAVICAGASKMHELEAYPLAMIASVMSLVGPFVPSGIALLRNALAENDTWLVLPSVLAIGASIPFSFWCISTLRNKKVIAGFAEEKPEDF